MPQTAIDKEIAEKAKQAADLRDSYYDHDIGAEVIDGGARFVIYHKKTLEVVRTKREAELFMEGWCAHERTHK